MEMTAKELIDLTKEIDQKCIDFGKWILRNFNDYGPKDEKELLQIFKKQFYDRKQNTI